MRAELEYVDESDLDLVLMLDARTNGPLSAFLLQLVGLAPTGGPISATRSTGRCAELIARGSKTVSAPQ